MHFNFQVKQWCRRRCDKFNVSIFAILPLHICAVSDSHTAVNLCEQSQLAIGGTHETVILLLFSNTHTNTHTTKSDQRCKFDSKRAAQITNSGKRSKMDTKEQQQPQRNDSDESEGIPTMTTAYNIERNEGCCAWCCSDRWTMNAYDLRVLPTTPKTQHLRVLYIHNYTITMFVLSLFTSEAWESERAGRRIYMFLPRQRW